MPYHVMIWPMSTQQQVLSELYAVDLSDEQLRERFIDPYDRGKPITWNGRTLPGGDISYIHIWESSSDLGIGELDSAVYDKIRRHPEVTNRWITGAPGHAAGRRAWRFARRGAREAGRRGAVRWVCRR